MITKNLVRQLGQATSKMIVRQSNLVAHTIFSKPQVDQQTRVIEDIHHAASLLTSHVKTRPWTPEDMQTLKDILREDAEASAQGLYHR